KAPTTGEEKRGEERTIVEPRFLCRDAGRRYHEQHRERWEESFRPPARNPERVPDPNVERGGKSVGSASWDGHAGCGRRGDTEEPGGSACRRPTVLTRWSAASPPPPAARSTGAARLSSAWCATRCPSPSRSRPG